MANSFLAASDYTTPSIASVDAWLENLLSTIIPDEVGVSTTTTTTTPSTFSPSEASPIVAAISIGRNTDVTYASDVERALQYSLTKEIPLNSVLDSTKMYAIHLWINVAIRYNDTKERIVSVDILLQNTKSSPTRQLATHQKVFT